jgi:Kef-type K+ transport system membrane component KefB
MKKGRWTMLLNPVLSDINFVAVLVAGFVHMATGLIWFSTSVFGRQWMELTKQEMKPAQRWIPAAVIGHLLIALVLAIVVHLANATTVLEGFAIGVLIWIGFVVTLEIGELVWEKIPFKLFMIRIGNHFVALGLAGAILADWR